MELIEPTYIYKNESMIIRLHTPFIDIYLLF